MDWLCLAVGCCQLLLLFKWWVLPGLARARFANNGERDTEP